MTLDEVYDAIGQFPEGLTTKQIADLIGKSANQVSGLASKLFHYGKVDREFAPGYRGIYRYKLKKQVEADSNTITDVKARYPQENIMTKKRTRQSTRRQAKKLEIVRTRAAILNSVTPVIDQFLEEQRQPAALELINQDEVLNGVSKEKDTNHAGSRKAMG